MTAMAAKIMIIIAHRILVTKVTIIIMVTTPRVQTSATANLVQMDPDLDFGSR